MLSVVKEITPAELTRRFLNPLDIGRLRRNIAQLKLIESEPTRRLLNMLNFEYQAITEAAKNHPAVTALLLVTRRLPPPAIIILVSQLNHDADALSVAGEKLSRLGFTTLPLEATRQRKALKVKG